MIFIFKKIFSIVI